MKIFKFFLFLLPFIFSEVDAQPLRARVSAKSAILYNPKNGAVLFEKDPNAPHYPASIMKIATAFFLLSHEKWDGEKLCRASSHALEVIDAAKRQKNVMQYPPYILEHDGVIFGLAEGDQLTLKDLVHVLMLISSNDVANVIAENFLGSIPTFMGEMNQFFQRLGIRNTTFQNPHGLFHPGQITCANDMAKITGLALANPDFRQIISKKEFTLSTKGLVRSTIQNTNRLLKNGPFFYPKAVGGKTGYIASSGHNLVAIAEDGDRQLVAVLLGCAKKEDHFKEAMTLFDLAFREEKVERHLFSKGDDHFERKISGVSIRAALEEDVTVSYYPSEEPSLKAEVNWLPVDFPLAPRDRVGDLVVMNEQGQIFARAPLLVTLPVDPSKHSPLWWGLILPIGFILFKYRRKILKR